MAKQSESLFQRAQEVIPGGVNSPVRAFRGVGGAPLFIEMGQGGRIFDADNLQYIDCVGSWGPMILGHGHRYVVEAVKNLYAPHAIVLDDAEHAAFAGNAIALSHDVVWMSAGAERALTPGTREALDAAGFTVRSVALDAIEAAGGSLRCCVAELF